MIDKEILPVSSFVNVYRKYGEYVAAGSLGSSTGFAFHEFAGFWLPMKILEEEYKLKCGSIAVNIKI